MGQDNSVNKISLTGIDSLLVGCNYLSPTFDK